MQQKRRFRFTLTGALVGVLLVTQGYSLHRIHEDEKVIGALATSILETDEILLDMAKEMDKLEKQSLPTKPNTDKIIAPTFKGQTYDI